MAHYVGNNPVNYVDPTGHCVADEDGNCDRNAEKQANQETALEAQCQQGDDAACRETLAKYMPTMTIWTEIWLDKVGVKYSEEQITKLSQLFAAMIVHETGHSLDPKSENLNDNGTVDYGLMQVNTINMGDLSADDLKNPYVNIMRGTQIFLTIWGLPTVKYDLDNLKGAVSCYNGCNTPGIANVPAYPRDINEIYHGMWGVYLWKQD